MSLMMTYEEHDAELAMAQRASVIAAELATQEDAAGEDLTIPPGAVEVAA